MTITIYKPDKYPISERLVGFRVEPEVECTVTLGFERADDGVLMNTEVRYPDRDGIMTMCVPLTPADVETLVSKLHEAMVNP